MTRSLIVGLVVVLAGCGEPLPNHDESMASIMCERFVTKRLRAPSTADFASYGAAGTRAELVEDSTYLVASYVDAQNGFGAMIRNDYICSVSYTGNNNWHLVHLEMK